MIAGHASDIRKIVIIDDEPSICLTFKHLLEDEGYEVQIADNGKTGMEVVRNWHPDMVITDLMMPEQDGFHTIREIRAGDTDMPIIAMSALPSRSEMEDSVNAAGLQYVSKPVDIATLLKVIREMSSRK